MIQQKSLTARAWAELSLLGILWGGSFVSIRIALDEVPFLTTVAHRVFWAALALWLVIALRRIDLPRDPRVWAALLVMGVLNNVIPFSLMAWGQLHISSGLTSIFNAATAIWGVLLSALVFSDERLTPNRMIGVALGFVGVATAIGLENLTQLDLRALAQLAILGGSLSYALAGIWARKRLGGLRPEVAAAGMLTGSSLIVVPVALIFDGMPSFALQTDTWVAIGYYALIATAGAYLLYYRVLALAGSGNLLLVTLLIPPVAIVLGAWLRDESLSASAYLGFAMLAAGLLTLNRRP